MASGWRRYGSLALVAALALACWVSNASRPGGNVEGRPEGYGIAGERSEGPLRVMSLNMLHGFPRFERLPERLDLIAEEIRRQDPDIICLQEVPWTPKTGNAAQYLGEQTGLNYVYLRANGNRRAILFEEGEAILSRYPLRDVEFTELWPRAGFFEHRVVLAATAVTPWGEVRVFVTHLTNGDAQVNEGQARSLMTFVAARTEGLAILTGDFNAEDTSPQIRAVARQAIDTYRATHLAEEGATCCVDDLSSGHSEPLGKRIDYVFLLSSPQHDVQVTGCELVLDQPIRTQTGWLWASDHIGLLTRVSIS